MSSDLKKRVGCLDSLLLLSNLHVSLSLSVCRSLSLSVSLCLSLSLSLWVLIFQHAKCDGDKNCVCHLKRSVRCLDSLLLPPKPSCLSVCLSVSLCLSLPLSLSGSQSFSMPCAMVISILYVITLKEESQVPGLFAPAV